MTRSSDRQNAEHRTLPGRTGSLGNQSENKIQIKESETWVPAPDLPYRPQDPAHYHPGIGLIGCGGITVEHLTAYRKAAYRVLALCDLNRSRAEERRRVFFPDAVVCNDHHQLLAIDDIEVVDVATHPQVRPPLIEDAIRSGRHVLSQKPFVNDLDTGERLADLADRHGVRLAVNQNGRWAPHFSYLRHAVATGILGKLTGVHFQVHWDHTWVKGTEFENVRHLILFDFAIHWFDILTCLMAVSPSSKTEGRPPLRVFATTARTADQVVSPALLGQAVVEYEGAQASLVFGGDTRHSSIDTTYVTGALGTFASRGMDLREQHVSMSTAAGTARAVLEGSWFPDGFHGTMGELLCAIEQGREPSHSARNNLASLALCFAAVASADSGQPVVPGSIRNMPHSV